MQQELQVNNRRFPPRYFARRRRNSSAGLWGTFNKLTRLGPSPVTIRA